MNFLAPAGQLCIRTPLIKLCAYVYFRYFSEFSGIKNDSNFFSPFFLTVVVLYTSPSCAFCQVATHIFHTLERLISSDLVNFLTIDSTQNDLPWSFTALAVPSVLYFHPRWVFKSFLTIWLVNKLVLYFIDQI